MKWLQKELRGRDRSSVMSVLNKKESYRAIKRTRESEKHKGKGMERERERGREREREREIERERSRAEQSG